MDKLLTARETIELAQSRTNINTDYIVQLERAIKEYAQQFIILAAKKATTMDDPNSYTGNTGSEYPADVIVDKKSILNIIELIK